MIWRYITLVALFQHAQARFAQMDEQYAKLVNETIRMSQMGRFGAEHKAFLGIIAASLESLTNYGCWCYFEEEHGRGRSHPQNEVDAICKVMSDGYDCAIRDGLAEGEPCEPWTVEYNAAGSLGRFDNSLQVACQEANPGNTCGIRACTIEGNFVLQIFATFLSGYEFDPSLHHFGVDGHAPWDPTEHCPIKRGPVSEISCCGFYPERFPFRIVNGDRACCGSFTYKTSKLQCCGEDLLKGKGLTC